MVENWVQRTANEYALGWSDLLPTGAAWPREPGTVLQDVVLGLSQIWGTEFESLAALLLTVESDPRSTNILLPDWEQAFGLPDNCFPVTSDIPTRQQNLVNKMTFIGAQSRAFFISQALLHGQNITIVEYSPYQCGISGVGDTTNLTTDGTYRWGLGPDDMRFAWTVVVSSLTTTWNGVDAFCIINRWKPAHTGVVFDYSALSEFNFSRPWNSGLVALM